MSTTSLTSGLLLQLLYPSLYYSLNPLTSGLGTSSSSTGTTDPSGISASITADQTELDGLGQLSSALTSFQGAVDGLLTSDQVAPATASSSDSTVATASSLSTGTLGTYDVTVNSLAEAQSVTSGSFADPSTTVVGSGTLTIQLGTYDSGSNTFTASATPSVQINVTNGTLDSIASAINSAGAGVNATVVQDGSGYHLSLTSSATGAANGFSISVADSDGTNTDTNGLSQLAYDPTAAVGAGQNLTLGQAAQDASLTVNGVTQTSASNAGISIASGDTVNLLQLGSTTVSVTQDTSTLQTSAQDFVTAYNNLYDTLQSLTSSSGALAGNSDAQQLLQQLVSNYGQSYTTTSFSGLAQIGIDVQTDGHLSLDTNALQSAATTDLSSTVSVLNQAAQAMDTLASGYNDPGTGIVPLDQSLVQNDINSLQFFQGLTPSSSATTLNQSSLLQYQAVQQYQTALLLQQSSALLGLSQFSGTGLLA